MKHEVNHAVEIREAKVKEGTLLWDDLYRLKSDVAQATLKTINKPACRSDVKPISSGIPGRIN
jgi:hypothetical protein